MVAKVAVEPSALPPVPPCPVCSGGKGHRAPFTYGRTSPSPRVASCSPTPLTKAELDPKETMVPHSPASVWVNFFWELFALPLFHTHTAFPEGARHQSALPYPPVWVPAPHLAQTSGSCLALRPLELRAPCALCSGSS